MARLQSDSVKIVAVLLLAAGILSSAAWLRGMEYDEAYSVFIAAGDPRPDWPAAPFRAGDVAHFYDGRSDAWSIAHALRQTDVHPPLYFWSVAAWRGVIGTDLARTRLLSVAFSLAALLAVAAIARLAAIPPATAMLLTLGCYGFSYTGHIARGFACAQMLILAGVTLLLLAERRRSAALGFGAGLLLGLASFANYLAVFVGSAALLWLGLRRLRTPYVWLAAGMGFALVMPADAVFFLAQRNSRAGQFPPFHLVAGLQRIAAYATANVFGGLPLYINGAARVALTALLAAAMVALAGGIVWRWRHIGTPGSRVLLALAACAPPVGLLLLGILFNNTPIELRYLAFATPFAALLIAGACASFPIGRFVAATVLAVQAVSLAGMLTRPETMQPQAATARAAASLAGAAGLVLVPRGNDGVGVVGPFVQAVPNDTRMLVVSGPSVPAFAAAYPRVVVAMLEVDTASRQTVPALLQAFDADVCWRRTVEAFNATAFDRRCP